MAIDIRLVTNIRRWQDRLLHAPNDLIRVMGKIPAPLGLAHAPFAQDRMNGHIHFLVGQVHRRPQASASCIKRPEKLNLLGDIFGEHGLYGLADGFRRDGRIKIAIGVAQVVLMRFSRRVL